MVECPHCGAVLNSTGITEHIEVCWLDNFNGKESGVPL